MLSQGFFKNYYYFIFIFVIIFYLVQFRFSELLNDIFFPPGHCLILGQKFFIKGTTCMELLTVYYPHS